MKCKQCGNEFEAKRSTAVYCSDKCKKRFQREVSGTNEAEVLSGTASNLKEEIAPVGFIPEEIHEYFKGSPTVLKIIEAGPEFPIEWGSCCQCGRKFTQEGFEKVIVCSTCFHRAWLKEDSEASSIETGCTCTPTDREEDCSACRRAGVKCEHRFYFCVEHQYHIESYCERMCA